MMYTNAMIDSYIYGDNSGKPNSAQTGQAMATFNIMETLSSINDRLAEIGRLMKNRLNVPEY